LTTSFLNSRFQEAAVDMQLPMLRAVRSLAHHGIRPDGRISGCLKAYSDIMLAAGDNLRIQVSVQSFTWLVQLTIYLTNDLMRSVRRL
jgi:hypothetical protein